MSLGEFLAMGGYGPYIWSAYGAAAVILAALFIWSWRGLKAAERREQQLGRRRRRRGQPDTEEK